jgi:hypothetical protein
MKNSFESNKNKQSYFLSLNENIKQLIELIRMLFISHIFTKEYSNQISQEFLLIHFLSDKWKNYDLDDNPYQTLNCEKKKFHLKKKLMNLSKKN